MSMNEMESKIKELRSLQRLIEEAQQEAVSSPVIKCKKPPRKKCSFVAEVKGKR